MKPHPPSYAPVLMAVGLMCTLWGAVTTWLLSAAGLIVVALAAVRWIGDARQEPETAEEPRLRAEIAARATVRPAAARRFEFRMNRPWLHRYAILVALGMFALVVTGALVASNPAGSTPFIERIHLAIAATVGILTVGLAFGLAGPAWVLLAAVAVQALLGLGTGPIIGTLHALSAQLIFAGTVGLSLITSASWNGSPEQVDDSARLSFRKLSVITLVLVILQISMGAAYRHQAMGVVPHIVGALVVTIAILLLCVLVTNQYQEHGALRPVAKTLIGITFAQVMLGMAAFITRLMMAAGTLPVVIAGVVHVANGSLTLAATTLLTLLIRRYVRPVS
jgi:heme A synthase